MKIPDDTPVEISEGVWSLFGDPEALAQGRLPLDANGLTDAVLEASERLLSDVKGGS